MPALHLVILLLLSNFLTHTSAELRYEDSLDSLNGQPLNQQYHMLFCAPQACPSGTNLWTYPDSDSRIDKKTQCKTVRIIPLGHPDEAIEQVLSLFLPSPLSMDELHENRMMAIDDLKHNYFVPHDIEKYLRKAAKTDQARCVKELQTRAIKKELDQITNSLIDTCNREQALSLHEMAQESLDRLKPATTELRIAQQTHMMALRNLLKLFGEHQLPSSHTLCHLREQVDRYFQSRAQR